MRKKPGILSGVPASLEWMNYVRAVLPPLDLIEEEVQQILATGALTNHGPYSQRLEKALADFFGLTHAVLVGNATVGLMLALKSLEPDGGEVIIPSFTFVATGDAVVWAGFEPIFADVDLATMCLDPAAVAELIGPNTVAIMPVHPFGGLCDVEAFATLAEQHNLNLIYDSAQAVGMRYQNRPVGMFGDAEVFSLHATKVLPVGEGGFISTSNAALAEYIRSMRNFDLDRGATTAGLNGKLTEFSAILGLFGLRTLNAHITQRTKAYQHIYDALQGVSGIFWQELPVGVTSNYQNLALRVDADTFGLNADELALALRHDNINTRRYFHPCLHQFPAFAHCRHGLLTNSELLARQCLALPLYSNMTDGEAAIIADAISHIHEHAPQVKVAVAAA